MTEESQFKSCSTLSKEQIRVNHSKTQTLLDASFMHGQHKAFKEHRMTPYHVICRCTGDHQELLELMIKELGRSLLNVKDDDECTALMYAVSNANINCVESLIASGADVNLINDKPNVTYRTTGVLGPLIDSIKLLGPKSPHSYNTMMGIFDLLLDSGADVNIPCLYHNRTPIMYAAAVGNVKCFEKLIQKGAQLNCTDRVGHTVWALAARAGSVDVLKCLIEKHGIGKNSTDKKGFSVLMWAVISCRIEAVRYLLNQGVTMTSFVPQECVEACKNCGTNLSCHYLDATQMNTDPYVRAIILDMLDVVRLMDEHGCQLGKSPEILSIAIHTKSVEVVEYLLCNYKYPWNYGYIEKHYDSRLNSDHQTFLIKACETQSVEIVKLLLERGADPNKKYCAEKCPPVLNVAIYRRHVKHLACFIRGGVNVNTRSHYSGRFRTWGPADIGVVLPFEAAVYEKDIYAAEMLLVAGCSRGIHCLDNICAIKANIGDEMQELLKKWNVHKNNVLPLKQRCRMVILNHLCPQADKKIKELPLPLQIIKYLSIPELDDILEKHLSANH